MTAINAIKKIIISEKSEDNNDESLDIILHNPDDKSTNNLQPDFYQINDEDKETQKKLATMADENKQLRD